MGSLQNYISETSGLKYGARGNFKAIKTHWKTGLWGTCVQPSCNWNFMVHPFSTYSAHHDFSFRRTNHHQQKRPRLTKACPASQGMTSPNPTLQPTFLHRERVLTLTSSRDLWPATWHTRQPCPHPTVLPAWDWSDDADASGTDPSGAFFQWGLPPSSGKLFHQCWPPDKGSLVACPGRLHSQIDDRLGQQCYGMRRPSLWPFHNETQVDVIRFVGRHAVVEGVEKLAVQRKHLCPLLWWGNVRPTFLGPANTKVPQKCKGGILELLNQLRQNFCANHVEDAVVFEEEMYVRPLPFEID